MSAFSKPAALPDALNGLVDLALDLRSTWCHIADELWRLIEPQCWVSSRNPWLILQSASEQHLAALARTAGLGL